MTAVDTLVVGLGSIGDRHARILRSLGRRVATVSRRSGGDYPSLEAAFAAGRPDYVVVATATADHAEAISRLAALDHQGIVLVEKPLTAAPVTLPNHRFAALRVGYNLRFHPAVQRLTRILTEETVVAVQAYVGQYLPTWRPGRDPRQTASATVAAGGGVLRDLSHELDLLLWLLGPWQRVAALGGRLGDVTVDSDDVAAVLLACDRCPAVSLHLNYFDRPGARDLVLVGLQHTIRLDLVRGTLAVDGEVTALSCARDDTYLALHRAVLSGADGPCTAVEGQAVVDLVAAIEQARRSGTWVSVSARATACK